MIRKRDMRCRKTKQHQKKNKIQYQQFKIEREEIELCTNVLTRA